MGIWEFKKDNRKRCISIHISLPGFKISTWPLISEKWVINIRDTKHVVAATSTHVIKAFFEHRYASDE